MTDRDPFEVVAELKFEDEPGNELDVYMSEVDAAYAMLPDDFMKLTPKQRERVLFILAREQAGQVRLLLFKVEEWESKLNATLSPEGVKELSAKFLDNFGGGMLKGLL